MKKFTKVLAAFCAMAMVFGTFSATVFAGEEDVGAEPAVEEAAPEAKEEAAAEAPAPAAKEEPEAAQEPAEKPAAEEPAKEEDAEKPAAEEPAKEEDANKEPAAEEPKAEEQEDVKSATRSVSAEAANGAAEGEDAGSEPVVQPVDNPEEPVQYVPFADGNITQTDINANDGKMPETAGTYTLTENVTVSKGAKIETQDASVTINLNGHTITYTATESMYVVGKVRGTDGDDHNSNNKTAPIDYDNTFTGVTLTINGAGTITGEGTTGNGSKDYWINGSGVGTDNGRGGCVLVEWGSTFILDGATITGFEANDEGGAICVSNGATFVMNSGAITNCSAGKGGGAISGHASSAATGPQGINIKASVTINGGTISGNEAGQLGGGVRINRAHFYLNGGEITNNNVKSVAGQNGGGGIEILHNKNGHEVMIQGSPKVYGNKVNGSVDVERANIFLDDCTITLSGDLSNSSKLGFSTKALTANCFNINGKSYSLNSFVSNHAGYYAYVSGSYIKLKQGTLPKVAGYNLVIGGDIRLKASFDLGTFNNSNTSITYAYSYTKGSNTVNVEKTVNYSDLGTSGSYKTVEIPVPSACFTSPITVTINCSDGQVEDDPVTIEQYIKAVIDGDYAQKVKDVAWQFRVFASIAMIQLNINMNDSSLRPQSWEIDGNIYDPTPTIYEIGEGAAYTPENDPYGAYYGASVSFISKTEVNMYFKKSVLGTTAPKMTVTYAGGSTEEITATENGSYYVYTVKGPTGEGFAATVFDTPFSFSVGTASGEYSVNTYLQVVEYKYHGSSNNVLLKLVEAYYDFARKCQQL